MRALASFVGAPRVNYQDLEVRIDIDPEIGLADSSDLDTDLTDLLTTLGNAAHERETALVFFIDELQYVPEDQLASPITALHSTSQEQLPITMTAAGLPQLVGRTGNAKSYADRLFGFAQVGRLDDNDARDALIVPASKEGVEFRPEAVAEVLRETNGYPYFLQEWGKHSWNTADHSPIMLSDAQRATREALSELDAEFLPCSIEPIDAGPEALLACHGRTWTGAPSIRRHRPNPRRENHHGCSRPQPTDRQRHDLQSRSRRHRIHRSALR